MTIQTEINIHHFHHLLKPFESILELFEKQAKQNPDKLAIIFNDQSLTYSALNAKINQMAAYILQYVKCPETLIAIALNRSLDLIISILASLKVGAAYIPLDPHTPKQRLQFILNDVKPHLLITSIFLKDSFKNVECDQISVDEIKNSSSCSMIERRILPICPQQLAYILYTSGSTGKPKGVMISHLSVVNFLKSLISSLPLQKADRFLSVTAPTFDISILEYFGTLLAGGTLILASHEAVNQGSQLLDILYKQKPTIMQATPMTWQMLLEAGWKTAKDFRVLCGGESLPFHLFKELLDRDVQLWNLYGPTETTIWSTFAKYTRQESRQEIHIGYPIAHTHIELAEDDHKKELCIAGMGVARGYLNRPDLTAEKFTPNPFISNLQEAALYGRLYHTGDKAVKLNNGAFKCLGRIDYQVKIRGHRIELEEIESVLNKQNQISQAIVIAESTPQGYSKLVAYILPKAKQENQQTLIAQIKEFLADQLSDYMIPQVYRFVESFPLTGNGKIDRKALPEIENRNDHIYAHKEPLSVLEDLLTKIYAKELNVKEIGIEEDVLGLGLDSLNSLKISMKLKLHHLFVKERTILSCSTIKQLAQSIENQKDSIPASFPHIHKTNLHTDLASTAQQRLWLMDQLLPVNGLYQVAYAFRLKGRFDSLKFENALKLLIMRHEILRTIFVEKNGEIYQQVIAIDDFPFSIEKWSRETLSSGLTIEQFLTAQIQKPFNLSSAPLFRVSVLQADDEEWILSFVMHHILVDEWSIDYFFQELQMLYEGKQLLSPLPIQHIDFTHWHRMQIANEKWQAQSAFWQQQLYPVMQEPILQTDHKRSGKGGYQTAQYIKIIPRSQFYRLQALIEQQKTTLFMALAAILHLFLYRYSHRSSVVIGTPIANRHYPDVEKLLGFLVNMVALKSMLSDQMSFEDLLSQMKKTVLDAYENQDIPFEHVVHELNIKRSLGIHPLFQVVLIVQNQLHPFALDGLTAEEIRLETLFSNPSAFDLTLWANATPQGLELRFEYAKEIFDEKTIQHFGLSIENLIESALANPKEKISHLSLFAPAQLKEFLHRGELYSYDPKEGVIENLEKYAALYPSKISTIFKDQFLTYGALLHRVNLLADHLIALGIQLEDPICVLSERNIEFLISILAILKVGATYVPIDPKLPKDRIRIILSSCRPLVILTHADLKSVCEELAPSFCLVKGIEDLLHSPIRHHYSFKKRELPSNHLVYMIFTSGSTGLPKGVMVEHDGMINHLYAKIRDLQLTSDDIIAQTATQAFDISIWQFLVGVFIGATTWICETEKFWDPQQFIPALSKHKITIAETVPSHIVMLLDMMEGQSFEWANRLSLRYLISTGEPLHASLARRWFNTFSDISIVNAYGPTECSDDVTHYFVRNDQEILSDVLPISGTVNNLSIYLLDHFYNIAPLGSHADLAVGGIGICRGYLHDPEKTAAAFVPDPFSSIKGARMYLTGDAARLTSANDILFLGRVDSQIKVRGYRIELEEIEEHLESHPKITRAKAILLNKQEKNAKIVAYFTCDLIFSSSDEQQQFISEIREFLFNQLPAYMIPSFFMILDQFPLNINGKIDAYQLPTPSMHDKIESVAPRHFIENLLVALLKKLLKSQKIGIYDNFFDLGANSLLAITLVSEIKHHFNRSLSIIDVFKSPTVLDLAKRIQASDKREETLYQIHAGQHIHAPRLFLMHASDGLTFAYSHLLFKDFNFSIYCLTHPYFGQENKKFAGLEEMASHYIEQIRTIQPQGPYYLGGWSFGGVLAFEMASQLEAMQQEIGHLFLIDSLVGSAVGQAPHQTDIDEILKQDGIKAGSQENRSFSIEMKNNHQLLANYQPKPKQFPSTLFKAMQPNHYFSTNDLYNGWKDIAKEIQIISLPAHHYEVFSKQESLKMIRNALIQIIGTQ